MSTADCPYCTCEIEICHDDGYGMDEGETYSSTCPHCEKGFVFTTCISVIHDAFPAPCQNGEPHKMEPILGAPAEFFAGKTRCRFCAIEQTDQEVHQAAMLRYRNITNERKTK